MVLFKGDHQQAVIDLVEKLDVPTVYTVNDAEQSTVDEKELDEAESIGDALTTEQPARASRRVRRR